MWACHCDRIILSIFVQVKNGGMTSQIHQKGRIFRQKTKARHYQRAVIDNTKTPEQNTKTHSRITGSKVCSIVLRFTL